MTPPPLQPPHASGVSDPAFQIDPDPAFYFDADPDPAFKWCGSGSKQHRVPLQMKSRGNPI
jgi:hypothetical protein